MYWLFVITITYLATVFLDFGFLRDRSDILLAGKTRGKRLAMKKGRARRVFPNFSFHTPNRAAREQKKSDFSMPFSSNKIDFSLPNGNTCNDNAFHQEVGPDCCEQNCGWRGKECREGYAMFSTRLMHSSFTRSYTDRRMP